MASPFKVLSGLRLSELAHVSLHPLTRLWPGGTESLNCDSVVSQASPGCCQGPCHIQMSSGHLLCPHKLLKVYMSGRLHPETEDHGVCVRVCVSDMCSSLFACFSGVDHKAFICLDTVVFLWFDHYTLHVCVL